MNHADFWVTPMARWFSWELTPFLQFPASHIAIKHLSRPSGAAYALLPTALHEVFTAVVGIREENHCVLETLGIGGHEKSTSIASSEVLSPSTWT